jgi:hypothetical protein
MQAIPVDVRRVESPVSELEADIARAEMIAKLMDSQFDLGGFKFGADAIVGLVPVVGDAVSFAVGMYPVFLARKHGLGRVVIGRMLMNLGIDFVAGAVPVIGDAIDVLHKANLKNLALLKKALDKRQTRERLA